MWRMRDFFNQDFVTYLADKALAQHYCQSASRKGVTSSWELVEEALLYFLPSEEKLRDKERVLRKWDVLDEVYDMVEWEGKRDYHERPEKWYLQQLYRAIKRSLMPEYKKLEALKKLAQHYLNAYWNLKRRIQAKQRFFDAYKENGWRIPPKELWKMKIYRKALNRIMGRYEELKRKKEEVYQDLKKKLEEAYKFLPKYLEIIRETSQPADWKVVNFAAKDE